MRRFKTGDQVRVRRGITGVNVPDVPAGCIGTVVATTVIGRPKTLHFALETPWGHKEFDVGVHRRHVELE